MPLYISALLTAAALAMTIAGGYWISLPRGDRPAPWNPNTILNELGAELPHLEGASRAFERVEVLAWQILQDGRPLRTETALLWGHIPSASAGDRWVLMQVYRHPDSDDTWHRSIIYTEPSRPSHISEHVWQGFVSFDHQPSTDEICLLAQFDFFKDASRSGFIQIAGEVRQRTWHRLTGEEPQCGFAPPGSQ